MSAKIKNKKNVKQLRQKHYRHVHCHPHQLGPQLMEKIRVYLKRARNKIYKGDTYLKKLL